MSRIVDLTLAYETGMRGVEIEKCKTIEAHGYNTRMLHLYSHAGTHMDSPAHFGEKVKTIDNIDINKCVGPAWIVDIEPVKARSVITLEQLGPSAEKIEAGHRVVLKSGWSKTFGTMEYRDSLPRLSVELAEWFAEKKIAFLGVEQPSVADVNNRDELIKVHHILLDAEIVVVEGLCNLHKLSKDRVEIYALPLKIKNGDGAPARVIAIE